MENEPMTVTLEYTLSDVRRLFWHTTGRNLLALLTPLWIILTCTEYYTALLPLGWISGETLILVAAEIAYITYYGNRWAHQYLQQWQNIWDGPTTFAFFDDRVVMHYFNESTNIYYQQLNRVKKTHSAFYLRLNRHRTLLFRKQELPVDLRRFLTQLAKKQHGSHHS